MRSMDSEILQDEARLSDFKRSTTKDMMSLQLGGLLEFAEKATVRDYHRGNLFRYQTGTVCSIDHW
jgi:hypothetical protein